MDKINSKRKKRVIIVGLDGFGNLVVTRAITLLEKGEIFGTKSLPHLIDFNYALDVDQPQDFELAEWILKKGKVILDMNKRWLKTKKKKPN